LPILFPNLSPLRRQVCGGVLGSYPIHDLFNHS
jgi:hypothetical protein